jgi:formate dehydrogenase maturation protein FdhE
MIMATEVEQLANNQFIILENNRTIFQSYDSIIAVIENGNTTLDVNKWDYSKTTGKYRNIFLNETKKKTDLKIKNGIYRLSDLNC